jgi:hypothetical protein
LIDQDRAAHRRKLACAEKLLQSKVTTAARRVRVIAHNTCIDIWNDDCVAERH